MPRGKQVISITDLEKMLNDRKSDLADLHNKRAMAVRKVEEIDTQISKLGGSISSSSSPSSSSYSSPAPAKKGRPGRRPKNGMSLVSSMESVLEGSGPMSVGDIMAGVEKTGYKSNSKNFRGIINQTLIKDKKFVSGDRGMYQLK